jgi:hypothetical protein
MDAGTDFGGHHRHHAATTATVNENHAGCASHRPSSNSASQSANTMVLNASPCFRLGTTSADPQILQRQKFSTIMNSMSLDEVIAFVARNQDQQIPTIGGRAKFRVRPNGDKAFVFITQKETARNENHDWIRKSLKIFNETGSFKTTDYRHSVNASYVLGLLWRIVTDQRQLSPIDSGIPVEEREILAAPPTEQIELRKSRKGQGRFRKRLIALRRGCYVTGLNVYDLLKASHIKPWKDSNNIERLDEYNGLLLTPNLDALLDAGYISFQDDGSIMISTHLPKRVV